MAPAAVYEGDVTRSEPAAGGQLFAGLKLWFSQSVPQRKWLIQNAENNGATIVQLDKQADILLVDHAKKNQAPNTFSYRFVEVSIRKGQLEDLQKHAVGSASRAERPVGSVRTAAKSVRARFTESEDQLLWDWVTPFAKLGGAWKGNEIYKQLEAFNGNHTFQSWRDRYIKHTQYQNRNTVREVGPAYEPNEDEGGGDHTTIQDRLLPSGDTIVVQTTGRSSRKPHAQVQVIINQPERKKTPEIETSKSSQQLTPPGSGRRAAEIQSTHSPSGVVGPKNDHNLAPEESAQTTQEIAITPDRQAILALSDGEQVSDEDEELSSSDESPSPDDLKILPCRSPFTQRSARQLYNAVPWIDNVDPERGDEPWERFAETSDVNADISEWRAYFYEVILPEYRRRRNLTDDDAFEEHKRVEDEKREARKQQKAMKDYEAKQAEQWRSGQAETQIQNSMDAGIFRSGGNGQVITPEESSQVSYSDSVHSPSLGASITPMQCANCFTMQSHRWRKDIHGRRLCDECGRFLKANGVMRPSATWTEPHDDQISDHNPPSRRHSNIDGAHNDDAIRRIALAGMEALEHFSSSMIESTAEENLEPAIPLSAHNLSQLEQRTSTSPNDNVHRDQQSSVHSIPGVGPCKIRSPKRGREESKNGNVSTKRLRLDLSLPYLEHSTQLSIISISSHESGQENIRAKISHFSDPVQLDNSDRLVERDLASREHRNLSQSPLFIPESFEPDTDESHDLTVRQPLEIAEDWSRRHDGRKSSPLQLVEDEEPDHNTGNSSQYAPSETQSEGDLFEGTQPALSQAWETAPQDPRAAGLLEDEQSSDDQTLQPSRQQNRIILSNSAGEVLRRETGMDATPRHAGRSTSSGSPLLLLVSSARTTHTSGMPLVSWSYGSSRGSPHIASSPSWPPSEGEEFHSLLSQMRANGTKRPGNEGNRASSRQASANPHVQANYVNKRIDTQALLQQSMPELDANNSFLIPPPEGGWETDSDIDVTYESAVDQPGKQHHIKEEDVQSNTPARMSNRHSSAALQEINDTREVDQYFASQTELYSSLKIEKPLLQTMQVRALESTNLDTVLAAHVLALMVQSYQTRKRTDPSFEVFRPASSTSRSTKDKKAEKRRRKQHVRDIVDGLIPNDIKGVWTAQDDIWLLGEDARKVRDVEKKHGDDSIKVRFDYLSAAFDS